MRIGSTYTFCFNKKRPAYLHSRAHAFCNPRDPFTKHTYRSTMPFIQPLHFRSPQFPKCRVFYATCTQKTIRRELDSSLVRGAL